MKKGRRLPPAFFLLTFLLRTGRALEEEPEKDHQSPCLEPADSLDDWDGWDEAPVPEQHDGQRQNEAENDDSQCHRGKTAKNKSESGKNSHLLLLENGGRSGT